MPEPAAPAPKTLEHLLERALELPPPERAAWIETSIEDPKVRRRVRWSDRAVFRLGLGFFVLLCGVLGFGSVSPSGFRLRS